MPTADNVMVDINLSLTFAIGPSLEDAEAFVYLLGCTRFDEFLAAEVRAAHLPSTPDGPCQRLVGRAARPAGGVRKKALRRAAPRRWRRASAAWCTR